MPKMYKKAFNASRLFRVFSLMLLVTSPLFIGCWGFSNIGKGIGGGPTFGYVFSRGAQLGWEVGGGANFLLRGNIGGSYRLNQFMELSSKRNRSDFVHYLVYEPWCLGGVTLGAAWSSSTGISHVLGIWEGAAIPLNDVGQMTTSLSLAIGWRYMAGASELYLAPKIYYARWPSFGN
jgi:hypothetical protein